MTGALAHERLLGLWEGEGTGHYPTIDPFSYRETIEVVPVADKPLARWLSSSSDALSGAPLHGDTGYVRSSGDSVELVLAHAFGITEIATAQPDRSGVLEFESRSLSLAPTAKSVTATRRVLRVEADVLEYDFWMAAVGVEMTHHLHAVLHRA
ncbi:MAG: FABP family protein [Microthrixaceae bacterium]